MYRMKISKTNLFFLRYTPDQSLYSSEAEIEIQKKKIFDIVNEPYTIGKSRIHHQFVGVYEVSKSGVHHYHFLFVGPISINSLKSNLKQRLKYNGNKEFASKTYECSQGSFDKSCIYMTKGKTGVTLFQNEDTNFKENYFVFLGVEHYASLWKDYGAPSDHKKKNNEKQQKFENFKAIALPKIEKEAEKHFLSLESYIKKTNIKTLYAISYRALIYQKLKSGEQGNLAQIAETSMWISLAVKESISGDIDQEIDEIGSRKYEKYSNE